MHLIKKTILRRRNQWVNNKVKEVKDKINSMKRIFNLIINLRTRKHRIQKSSIIKFFIDLMCKIQIFN